MTSRYTRTQTLEPIAGPIQTAANVLAGRRPSSSRALDARKLVDWLAATESRIAAKLARGNRYSDSLHREIALQRVIDEQQRGMRDTDDLPERKSDGLTAAESGWQLEHQLQHGARFTPHFTGEPPLFDDAARARVVTMRRAGASYATIECKFRGYRGAPGRRGYEQIVRRATQ